MSLDLLGRRCLMVLNVFSFTELGNFFLTIPTERGGGGDRVL